MRTIVKAIVYIAVIGAVIGLIAVIYKYTNGFSEDFKTFYVEYDGEQILTKETKLKLAHGNTYKFDVKYTFEKDSAEPKDYSVKVVPNVTPDFEYTIDEKIYKYSSLKDISIAFELKKDKTSFSMTLEDGFSLNSVLRRMHGGKNVEVDSAVTAENDYPFRLEISSYNGEVTYKILFNVVSGEVTGVTLDTEYITFEGR